jgi:hypothetical protein
MSVTCHRRSCYLVYGDMRTEAPYEELRPLLFSIA